MPIIAEDLGVITADVHALRQSIGAPGMVVLQFAWGSGPTNTHLPHNHYENSVCYPGEAPFGSIREIAWCMLSAAAPAVQATVYGCGDPDDAGAGSYVALISPPKDSMCGHMHLGSAPCLNGRLQH